MYTPQNEQKGGLGPGRGEECIQEEVAAPIPMTRVSPMRQWRYKRTHACLCPLIVSLPSHCVCPLTDDLAAAAIPLSENKDLWDGGVTAKKKPT